MCVTTSQACATVASPNLGPAWYHSAPGPLHGQHPPHARSLHRDWHGPAMFDVIHLDRGQLVVLHVRIQNAKKIYRLVEHVSTTSIAVVIQYRSQLMDQWPGSQYSDSCGSRSRTACLGPMETPSFYNANRSDCRFCKSKTALTDSPGQNKKKSETSTVIRKK